MTEPALITHTIDLAASPTLTTVRDVAGDDAARALVQARGGTTVWLPRGVTADCPLAQIVGIEAALRITARFGTDRALEIPTGRGLGHSRRLDYDYITALARSGRPTPDIARECCCSTRQVRNILSHAGITRRHPNPTVAQRRPAPQ